MAEPPTLVRVPVARVHAGPNVRVRLDDIEELALSIKTLGLIKPLIVSVDGDEYQILDGHRRLAALKRIGVEHVEVIVRGEPSERARLAVQVALASHSARLDPMTEARTIEKLMFEHLLTREQIAAMLGRSPAWVRGRTDLLRLTPTEQQEVERGRMSVTEAHLRLRSHASQAGQVASSAVGARAGNQNAARSTKHCRTCSCQDGGR
jgi:ParB family chromosome partitioning protein